MTGKTPDSDLKGYRRVRVDRDGRLLTTPHPDTVQRHRSDDYSAEEALSSDQVRLVHLSGWIKAAAAGGTFYVHALDAAGAPGEDDAVDPLTTLAVEHTNGSMTPFSVDPARQFERSEKGLFVGLSTDPFTFDADGLGVDDEAYFEIDYLEA